MSGRNILLIVVGALVLGYLYQYGQAWLGGDDGSTPGVGPRRTGEEGEERPRPDGPRQEPFILVTPARVVAPGTVTLAAHRFDSGEEIEVKLRHARLDGVERRLARAWADEHGQVPALNLEVPADSAPGPYVVEAQGLTWGLRVTAHLEVARGGPWLELNPYAGQPGSTLAVRGGGFEPGEEVTVHWGSLNATPAGRLTPSDYGEVQNEAVEVPYFAEGDVNLFLLGDRSGQVAHSTFSVLGFHPYLVLNNYNPRPQDTLTVTGESFAPGESVLVFLNEVGSEPVGVMAIDQDGQTANQVHFTVPLRLEGENELVAMGNLTRTPISAQFEVTPFAPSLELTAYAVRPGTWLALSGRGFARNEAVQVFIGGADSGSPVSDLKTDDEGAFYEAGGFIVPHRLGGEGMTLTVVGADSQIPATIEAGLVGLEPSGELSQYYGHPGDEIWFGGHGFAANEEVAVSLGDQREVIAVGFSDADGHFSEAGPYTMPPSDGAETRFRLVGQLSGAETSLVFSYGDEPQAPPPAPAEGDDPIEPD